MTHSPENWSALLHQQLQRHRHRACVVLCGEASMRWQQLNALIPQHQNGLVIGEVDTDSMLHPLPQASAIAVKSLKHQLGQETDFAIFDAELGLDADALAIVIGMIRAGGCCYLCLPPKETFLAQPNPAMRPYLNAPLSLDDTLKGFQNYVWHSLQNRALWLFPEHPLPDLSDGVDATPLPKAALPTKDQQQAIDAIHHLAFGHRKRPLVLTADRGRGKSYTLGLACLKLLEEGKQHITLTAARRAQLENAFVALVAGIHTRLTLVEKRPGLVIFERNGKKVQVEFKAPDALLAEPSPLTTDVIMVDEAAHLPLPMLQAILQKHSRVLLSTTQQGYEGSGRGFSLKLSQFLQQNFPNWKAVTLSQPIRWNPQDPLEQLLNRLLCLQNTLAESKTPLAFNPEAKLSFMRVDPLAMLKQADGYQTLHSLFQLLSQAHYQTRPNDLMQLLEVPNQQLWIAKADEQIIGVLRSLSEGDLPLNAPNQRQQGRQQGHLFPQLLAKNSHQPHWRTLKTWRIQRLAITPEWQNHGLGSQLLNQFIDAQHTKPMPDALTTSFGASPGLVKFWGAAGFLPVHLGEQKDKASGLHSVAMIAPLSATAQTLTAQNGFAHQFAWHLTGAFQTLDTELVYQLLCLFNPALKNPTEFPAGYLENQPFEAVSWALREWTLAHPACLKHPGLGVFWCQKVLQNRSWSAFSLNRKQLEKQFKSALMTVVQS